MATKELARFTEFGRKIVGVGFNYRSLIKELSIPPIQEPRIYLKASSSYITQGHKIQVPEWSKEGLFYEVELGVVIGKPLFRATREEVVDGIGGYCTALDMTDKARLQKAIQTGLAWGIAKSFNSACPVGDFIPKQNITDLKNVCLWLKVNGELRQHGNTSDMTWPVVDLISIMSNYFTLERGDMILTGTPARMGTAKKGDILEAGIKQSIQSIDQIKFEVASD